MAWHRYRFRGQWRLAAPPGAVYAVLARPGEYPAWWPQVREVAPAGAGAGRARFRSVLPYDLRVTARETRREPGAGVLEIAMTGDLEGWARWTVRPEGSGTRLLFEQRVEVRRPLVRLLAVPGRPFFRLNHRLMMAAGLRGLRRRLAAGGGRPESGLDEA
ncbi:SRPBCC family protein [Streptomyces sp. JJ36]|uniref:SRPBCC family protein n=1 Tax=Streptomyces sp. JJ36 TaxID=2736645 RepID=UPI001F2AB38D|nr:SRPBCC family protein [Streptomyces sp. JJ36]MCF6525293.1 SRPBCC family protein [Streptomyces sp. JJ36]